MYLLLDLETTGLDPHKDQILEVGAILLDRDLRSLGRMSRVCHYSGGIDVAPVVQQMHTENGLWDESLHEVDSVYHVDSDFAVWVSGSGLLGLQLAGASIHFDRSFMAVQMPCTLALLSHRQVDISGVARELRECGVAIPRSESTVAHRSMPDCEAELAEWRAMRAALRALT